MTAQAAPCWAVSVSRAHRCLRTTEAKLLTSLDYIQGLHGGVEEEELLLCPLGPAGWSKT